MRRLWQLLAVVVAGTSLGVAVVGCDSSISTNMDKMSSNKMTGDKKMNGDKMTADNKMGDNKMSGDKMSGGKGGM